MENIDLVSSGGKIIEDLYGNWCRAYWTAPQVLCTSSYSEGSKPSLRESLERSLLWLPSPGREVGMRVKVSPWGTVSLLASGLAEQLALGKSRGLWAWTLSCGDAADVGPPCWAFQEQVPVSTSISPEPSVQWCMRVLLGSSCAGGKQRGHSSLHRPECGVSMAVTETGVSQQEKWGSSGEATQESGQQDMDSGHFQSVPWEPAEIVRGGDWHFQGIMFPESTSVNEKFTESRFTDSR